ncbi:hypothetical protein [Streptomyces sp. MMG1121]|uniref:hypothetical protein n=1 Tax=Streptomyces sp. MMG1121 TaxID=1415544 RepID=UPI0006AFBE65|nr:hypothetical protein [Streptomyces sp. MMG1121]KOV71011.1 hypothetical protein ADK64_01255 [Streptomyces sp. MMG1121]
MEIDRGGLSPAYGPADVAPGPPRATESEDADVRGQALDELSSALCHQADVYPASAPAVPHLARLALDGPGHRRESPRLLGGIADAAGQPAERAAAQRAVAEALPPTRAAGRGDSAPLNTPRPDGETTFRTARQARSR